MRYIDSLKCPTRASLEFCFGSDGRECPCVRESGKSVPSQFSDLVLSPKPTQNICHKQRNSARLGLFPASLLTSRRSPLLLCVVNLCAFAGLPFSILQGRQKCVSQTSIKPKHIADPRPRNAYPLLQHPQAPRSRLGRSRSCRQAQEASRWSWSCRWSEAPPIEFRQGERWARVIRWSGLWMLE